MITSRSTALLFTFLFAASSFLLVSYHEMWRDELQAWLLARDSASVPELLANLKYEGHPGLWHLMLYPLTRIFETPEVMQYFHVVIAATSVFVLMRWSPFTTLQKILLCFSYFLFYEYSIIARNYAISVLLIFLICAMFPKRKEYPLALAGALFLLSHTSVYGLMFALCLFSTILFEEVLVGERDVTYRRLTTLNTAAITIASLGFITAIIQITPPNDSGFATAWRFHPSLGGLKSVYGALFGAYFPLPNFSLSYWNSKVLLSSTTLAVLSMPILVGLIYAVCRFLVSKPAALFLYLSVSSALMLFIYTKFSGSIRHHGFLFIALVATLWIYNYCGTKSLPPLSRLLKPLGAGAFNPLISFVFSVHLFAGVMAGLLDYKYPFSAAKQTAEFLKRNNLISSEIIGYPLSALAVVGYIPNKRWYNAEANKYGTFWRLDIAYKSNKVDFVYLNTTSAKLALQDKEVVLVLNRKIEDFEGAGPGFEMVFESTMPTVGDEKFYVYRFLAPTEKAE